MQKLGTACGVWGDIIVGLGYYLDRIKEGKIIYLGNNDDIVKFLNCQPYIKNVQKIPVPVEMDWKKYWLYTVFSITYPDDQRYTTFPEEPFLKAGYDKSSFKITHLTQNDCLPEAPIYQWHGVKLPNDVKAWAAEMASKLPEEFYLFQPYSFNSNNPLDHWQNWDGLCHLITKRTNKKLVVIGNDWLPKIDQYSQNILGSKTISLYNETPSMLHIFALARHAKGVITTSNSLAHWCQIDNLPCTVICNRKSTRKNYLFRRVLEWPTISFVEFNDDVDVAFNTVSENIFSQSKFV
jgi:hypothetical protein